MTIAGRWPDENLSAPALVFWQGRRAQLTQPHVWWGHCVTKPCHWHSGNPRTPPRITARSHASPHLTALSDKLWPICFLDGKGEKLCWYEPGGREMSECRRWNTLSPLQGGSHPPGCIISNQKYHPQCSYDTAAHPPPSISNSEHS